MYVQVTFVVYSVFHQPVTPNIQDFYAELVDTANILVPCPYFGSPEWSVSSVHFHPTFSVFEPVKALVDAFLPLHPDFQKLSATFPFVKCHYHTGR